MNLPKRIFFTGVPGSRWSGIAQTIEKLPGFNTSDRTIERSYSHNQFSGHVGAYFGRLMELEAILEEAHIDSAWENQNGTRLIKSHDWAYQLNKIKQVFPNDWIMLVHRPNLNSFEWWKQAGGFDISYPNYASYINDDIMKREIDWQNQSIEAFAREHNLKWSLFNQEWVEQTFGATIEIEKVYPDIQVTILK